MKNFIFISPNFPENFQHFCRELNADGLRVLGIGDCAFDALTPVLRNSLTEYYRVGSLENYGEVYRAVAYFIFRYGRIDWLESNNEYWLTHDAMLRTDFNITSGWQTDDLQRIRYKSGMKEYYRRAGIPAARWHIVDDFAGCTAFIRETGWPVIVKPDDGVGASDTHKLKDEEDLRAFLAAKRPGVSYIMEEFITAQIVSYDAVIDSRGEPLFETGNVTPVSIMDIVNRQDNTLYYIVPELAEDVRAAGRAAVKSFGVRSRFVHFEFFRLTCDQHIGKAGQIVALEVNMRPSGGFSTDMMNYANSTDVYKIWADMIAFDRSTKPVGQRYFCAFAGRRDGRRFALPHEALCEKYAAQLRMVERVPEALAEAMSNQMYLAVFPTQEEMDAFFADVIREA